MKKNILTMTIFLSIVLVVVYTLTSTYAVIINVISKDGLNEIVNTITIRDLLTDDLGNYNNTYYEVVNELNITKTEAEQLMTSNTLNETLKTILQTLADYKVENNQSAKLSNQELYNLIVQATRTDETITSKLKDKVINKTNQYIQDISDFIYDLDVSILKEEQ